MTASKGKVTASPRDTVIFEGALLWVPLAEILPPLMICTRLGRTVNALGAHR